MSFLIKNRLFEIFSKRKDVKETSALIIYIRFIFMGQSVGKPEYGTFFLLF